MKIGKGSIGCLVGIEPNYLQTMGTKIIKGNSFEHHQKSDEKKALINETTVRQFNLTEPIGTRLKLMGKEYTVIGVVEDVQYRTLHEPALPVLYTSNYSNYRKVAIRLHPGNHVEAIKQIKSIWSEKYPNELISMNFLTPN